MKPSIPETGTVIRLQGEMATVILKGGKSCKGCGQAKIGLCRAGETNMVITAKNPIAAKVGDSVIVELDRPTMTKGYFLAFIIPVLSLIFGTLAGHIVGKYLSIPSLEVMVGFMTFFLVSFFSFRRLKILDSSSSIVIKSVISDSRFSESIESDEMRRYAEYLV